MHIPLLNRHTHRYIHLYLCNIRKYIKENRHHYPLDSLKFICQGHQSTGNVEVVLIGPN